MPKLIVIAACEKAIFDRQLVPSLISIFQRMDVHLTGVPLPDKALSPLTWCVFTLWQHDPDEIGVEFVQKTEITTPNGDLFFESSVPFKITMPDDLQSKNQLNLFGLPINDEGFIKIRVWLENVADSSGEYRFRVRHIAKEQNQLETSNT